MICFIKNCYYVFNFYSAKPIDNYSILIHILFLILDSSSTIKLLQTSKGKPRMVFEGYSFIQNCSSNNRIYWLCSLNRKHKCNARIITSLNYETFKTKKLVHNHLPDLLKEKKENLLTSKEKHDTA